MKKISWGFTVLLLAGLSTSTLADTLYQANIGSYSVGGGFSAGIGFGGATYGYSASYPVNYGYYSGINAPYEGPNYPYGQSCCRGCYQCNNCSNGYGSGCH